MQQFNLLLNKPYVNFCCQKSNYVYAALKIFSNTTIFIQYNPENFLSFRVYEISQGIIVYQKSGDMAIQCHIRDTAYLLTRNHILQMSYHESQEFFNHLGIDSSQFLPDWLIVWMSLITSSLSSLLGNWNTFAESAA